MRRMEDDLVGLARFLSLMNRQVGTGDHLFDGGVVLTVEHGDQLIEDDCIANEALTDEALEKILSLFERYIDRNDLFWDIYWEIVRSAIIEHLKEENV